MAGRMAEVVVELLRAGPAHNRLLSPLTDYVTLCGNHGVSAVRVPFEHLDLQAQLNALSYTSQDGGREHTIQKLGREVGAILGSIPGLPHEVAHAEAQAADDGIIHVRLVLWGNELGLIPFELATTPPGMQGEGLAMLLRARTPIVFTREVRGSRGRTVGWDRKPRILFAAASPPGLAEVPTRTNLAALRDALEGLTRHYEDPQEQVAEILRHLTVLPEASLSAIRKACSDAATEGAPYTHVHILAHGCPLSVSGEARFGIALHGERDPMEIVSAQRLAHALGGSGGREGLHRLPLVVTLASCESGAGGSVLAPGGSVAHDLHQAGIPWVIASQFPLTFEGSAEITRVWYSEVLKGVDPRRVLHTVRSRLFTRESATHDWASLVAYATIPEGFSEEVEQFRYRQDIERAHRALSEAEHDRARASEAIRRARQILDEHEGRLPAREHLPSLNDPAAAALRATRANFFKRRGAFEKRAALLEEKERVNDALRQAREFYARASYREGDYHHWALTQVLSLHIVVGDAPEDWLFRSAWISANHEYSHGDPAAYRFALSSLIELAILSAALEGDRHTSADKARLRRELHRYLDEYVQVCDDPDVRLRTASQIDRYRTYWPNPRYDDLVALALDRLQAGPAPIRAGAGPGEPNEEVTTDFRPDPPKA